MIEKLESPVVMDKDVLIFSGKVIAKNVSYDEYLSGKYGTHIEWIHGVVIAMSPVSVRHDFVIQFLTALFRWYLELTGGGVVLRDPVVMKAGEDFPARQPDIQVLLPDRMHSLKENRVEGPANLVVEVVSPESVKRDRGEKFSEYERAGVDEYWLVDSIRTEALFYIRGEDGLFHARLPEDGVYTSQVLGQLKIEVALFWQDELPTMREILEMVEAMLKEQS